MNPSGEPAVVPEVTCRRNPISTGRILRPLAELGHPVLGVGESPEMLARVPDLPTIRSSIEALALDRRFDAVLLASTMLNAPTEQRRAFLATCARHLAPDGVVVIQQTAPDWFDAVTTAEYEHNGIRRVIRSVGRDGPRVDVVIEYHVGDRTWTHAFGRYRIDDNELVADLTSAGLRFRRWLTDDRAWFTSGRNAG